ncbi:MaoC/PaaZ C-terminal domain-containing protein [Rhodococcus opacus]|uniref:MaoC/PaaZ C-terminal domain-containing protein n=1 Tax=Rhodococcus opacus TaxID=37919 RepID=UPI001FF1DEA4|nr:MaoC/PaaZ C-terminal domain-containing protein [Rhodococcus opacus]UOT04343.1 MaoC/PaaZ C-terminal domain-containing protein [Rhodococcus opacus]
MTTYLTRPAELLDLVGEQLGTTDWCQITDERVNLFADATGDYRSIPFPPPRTAAAFENVVASGYLTLSLLPRPLGDLLTIDSPPEAVEYGLNEVRFPTSARVGTKVRCTGRKLAVQRFEAGLEAVFGVTFESEDAVRPLCVAEPVVIYR